MLSFEKVLIFQSGLLLTYTLLTHSSVCRRETYHIFKTRADLRNTGMCTVYNRTTNLVECGVTCNQVVSCQYYEHFKNTNLCLLCINMDDNNTHDGVTPFTNLQPNSDRIFEKDDTDHCLSSPCLNGATCVDGVYSYTCTCQPGWTGILCEADAFDECSSNPCTECQTCTDGPALYQCQCNPGFTGTDCSTVIDHCASNPCSSGETCVNKEIVYDCTSINSVTGTDCADLYKNGATKSGLYHIQPAGHPQQIQVFCDMQTNGGGWLVFQRRVSTTVDFDRKWADYKAGFGDLLTDFWLGNDNLAVLTKGPKRYVLRVDLISFVCVGARYAQYEDFKVYDESNKYKLSFGTYSGTAGNSLANLNNTNFGTRDRDNDQYGGSETCTQWRGGAGFWYEPKCFNHVVLNGKYSATKQTSKFYGFYWNGFRPNFETMKSVSMMFRQLDFP